jgi:hypothetical protein
VNWIYDPISKVFASQSAGLSDIPTVNKIFLISVNGSLDPSSFPWSIRGKNCAFGLPLGTHFSISTRCRPGGITLFPRGVSWSFLESLSIIARQRITRSVHFSMEHGGMAGKIVLSVSRSGQKCSISMRCRLGGITYSLVESRGVSWSLIARQRITRSVYFSKEHGGHGRENCAFGLPLGTKILYLDAMPSGGQA